MVTPQIAVGAVVMWGRRRSGVVLAIRGDRAVVAPLKRRQSPPLRGDVPVDPADPILATVGATDMVVRCGSSNEVPIAGQVTVGRVASGLIERLRIEAARAANAAGMERSSGPIMRVHGGSNWRDGRCGQIKIGH